MNNRTYPLKIRRLFAIRRAIKQYGLAGVVDAIELPPIIRLLSQLLFGKGDSNPDTVGERLRLTLESLGPIFIKLGQALSTRPDLLPASVAAELAKLQEEVPPFSGSQAVDIIKQALGKNFDSHLDDIDVQPLASASVAQVHAAVLKDNIAILGKNGKRSKQVVIKVLRPGIEKTIHQDLAVMYWCARRLQKYWKRSAQFKPLEVVREYDHTIHGELDLKREAANCSQMGANFADTDIIYVPQVYWDLSSKNVMVMERIYGTSIRNMEQLTEQGHDLKKLAEDGVNTFFKQAFEDNFFHADMHPGNIYVSDQGKWIAIDFGIMGVLDDRDKRYLAEMLLGFFHRDYQGIAQAHLRAGWIPQDTQLAEFEAAVRMVCEPNFAKPISEISFGNVLMQLFQTVRRFDMPLQPQLVLLYKTLLNIEGLGRQLYPQLNLWDTAKPFLEDWMKQQMSPTTLMNDLKKDWPRWRTLLSDMPEQLSKVLQQAEQSERRAADTWQKKNQTRLHQGLGLSLAMLSALALLFPELRTPVIEPFSGLLPVVLLAGIAWAVLKSR